MIRTYQGGLQLFWWPLKPGPTCVCGAPASLMVMADGWGTRNQCKPCFGARTDWPPWTKLPVIPNDPWFDTIGTIKPKEAAAE